MGLKDILRPKWKRGDSNARKQAIESGRLSPERLVWLALNDSDSDVRRVAIEHLGKHGNKYLVKHGPDKLLGLVINDRDAEVRRAAMDHLVKHGKKHIMNYTKGLFESGSPLQRERFVELLVSQLQSSKWGVRHFLKRLAKHLTDRRSAERLRAVAEVGTDDLSVQAIRVLLDIGPPDPGYQWFIQAKRRKSPPSSREIDIGSLAQVEQSDFASEIRSDPRRLLATRVRLRKFGSFIPSVATNLSWQLSIETDKLLKIFERHMAAACPGCGAGLTGEATVTVSSYQNVKAVLGMGPEMQKLVGGQCPFCSSRSYLVIWKGGG